MTGVIDDALAQLSPVLQHIVMTIGNKLLTDDQFAFLGLFDWAYNRDPADDMTGTFALGSTLDLAQLIVGRPVTPLDFTFDFSASAFVIPEPSTILIFASALLGLVALRRRDGDPHRKCPLSGPQGTIFFGKMGDSAEAKAGQERDPPVSSG